MAFFGWLAYYNPFGLSFIIFSIISNNMLREGLKAQTLPFIFSLILSKKGGIYIGIAAT